MRSRTKSALKHVIVSLGLFLMIMGTAWGQTPQDWALGLARAGTKTRPHCSAVLIAARKALTARHCIDNQRPMVVASHENIKPVAVLRYQLVHDHSPMFPLEDLAILELSEDLRRPSYPQLAQKPAPPHESLLGFGYGLNENCKHQDCFRLQGFQARAGETMDGQRLFGLTVLINSEGDGPCRGDSGAGVFIKKAQAFQLVGLVSGQLPELFQGHGLCRDPYALMTDISAYRSWILDGKRPPFQQGSSRKLETWTELCRHTRRGEPLWSLTQALLLQSAGAVGGWSKPEVRDALLHCRSPEHLITSAAPRHRYRISGRLLARMSHPRLGPGIQHLELMDVDQNAIQKLASFSDLKSLHIVGLDDGSDLEPLRRLPKLEELHLRHGRKIRGLPEVRLKARMELKLVDIQEEDRLK